MDVVSAVSIERRGTTSSSTERLEFFASDHSLRLPNALSTATSHLGAESHGIHTAREYRRISETVVRQRMGRRGGEENGRWK